MTSSVTKFVADPRVTASQLGEDLVLLDLSTETYFSLNPTGAEIWAHLKQGATIRDIAAAIAGKFSVTAADCEPDVAALISDMARSGLVRAIEA